MQKICCQCQKTFFIRPEDQEFYTEMHVSAPTLCYLCCMQRRLSYRNERYLYHRKCGLTGKQIISSFSIDKPFPVYDVDAWWTDEWSPYDYGRDVDFNKPFFDQFFDVRDKVPRLARQQQRPMENCDYCNCAGHSRNSYLCFSSNNVENCYHGTWINFCVSCVDCINVNHSELCYECVNCTNCYHLRYSRDCKNCRDSLFLRECIGCRDCFGCFHQVRKQYMIFNEQKTKEEYEIFMRSLNFGSFATIEQCKEKFSEFSKHLIVKEYYGTNLENSLGNYLHNCKNAYTCFECEDVEDAAYSACLTRAKKAMDHAYWGDGTEKTYECQACGYGGYHLRFCNLCWSNCRDLIYCDQMFSSKNCFGCVGLKRGEYAILNKKYTRDEYEKMVPRIIEYMKETGEWSEFFPIERSCYAYNETVAQEQMPLNKEETLARGWQWKDEEEAQQRSSGVSVELPDDICSVPDDIVKRILYSTLSGKSYKVVSQELVFYREQQIPLPRRTPNERYYDRFLQRNKRVMYERVCGKCAKPLLTTYSPDSLETVYCEQCYLQEVYV